ncbi:phytoene synthase [Hoeflea olei]|uniref:Phytoene synthase n=1 Tax=Hoeflea olei TaxID=1480615 RepID=A0A1C1YZU3_9HYPH|nr:phytoene synthase [Hoeflea olei]
MLARLRAADLDRYLALLLMPEHARDDLLALMLFNAEIASVRDRVREPLPGEIRLQWWRDVLAGERAGEAEANPVARLILDVIARRHLPRAPLLAMCEARIFDLYDDPMPDRDGYEGYAGETAATVLHMSALILDSAVAAGAGTASGHAGVAQAVAGHLLMLPITQARGQVFLPADLLAATGLDRDSFLAGDNRPAIGTAVRAFSSYGREHLTKAKPAIAALSDSVFPAYLPVSLVEPVLARAERLGADSLSGSLNPAQWRRQWRLLRSARRGRL